MIKLPRTKEKYPTVTTRPSNLLPSPTSKNAKSESDHIKITITAANPRASTYIGGTGIHHSISTRSGEKKKSHFRKETVGEGKYTSHTFHFRKVKRGRRGEAIKRCCCRQIHCWEVKRMKEREKVVRLAKLAEQAERYDDMVEFMKTLARMDVDMSAEERLLFSVGFKKTIGARRASWRILESLEQKVTAGEQPGVTINGYKKKVEDELRAVCNEVLSIIAIHCLPLANSGENVVFFYKMKGDYYRYLAEFSTGTEKKAATDQSLMAYQHAMVVSSSELSPAHQFRLGLALNFSVFFYEIMNSPERASQVAKQALDEATAEINSAGVEGYKDSMLMMQLLKENLALWTSELTGGETSKDDDVVMEG